MKEFTSLLKDFGFSKKDADVYLAVLEIGEAQISDIAKKAKLPRTTCYEIVNALVNRHMLSFFAKRGRRIYVAEDPGKIVSFFEQRSGALKELLPELKAMEGRAKNRPSVRFYEGEGGLGTILNEVILEKRNFDAITSIDDAFALLLGNFSEFIEQRRKHFLRVRLLTHRSSESQKMKAEDGEALRETRFVPGDYTFKTANFIFGDKVALLSLKEERPAGLIIEDLALADTFRMYFELLWKSAEKR